MAASKSNAALELDASVTESETGNAGEQQNSGNQGNSNNSGKSDTGNGNDTPTPDEKMGLAIFVQRASPNKYVIAMLKNKNAMEVHTLEQWQQIVKDLLGKKV